MKRLSIAFALVLLCSFSYAQRSGIKREDRQYISAKVNQFFNSRFKSFIGNRPIEFLNENNPFLLGNTFPIDLHFKKEDIEKTKATMRQKGFMIVATLYLVVLKEFPQFTKVELTINDVTIVYTLNHQQHTLSFYDELAGKDQLVNMNSVVDCNCF